MAYTEDVCTISKTDDDKFLVSIKKRTKLSKRTETAMPMENTMIKTYVADTVDDVSELMKKHLSGMKKGQTDEEAFDEEFKKVK